MPNPNDQSRAGKNKDQRATALWSSAQPSATTKKSWSEWLMGDGILAQTTMGTGSGAAGVATDAVTEIAKERAAKVAMIAALQAVSGTWVVTVGGVVGVAAYEAVQNKLDEKFKVSERVKSAANSGFESMQRYRYGGDPNSEKLLTQDKRDDMTLDKTIEDFRENAAFLQDILNRLAGKAGKAYYCDDAHQLAAMAQKSAGVKASLEANIATLRAFLSDMEDELKKFDPVKVQDKVMDIVKAICDSNNGRHWDNSWTATATAFRRCSKEHCHGP